jgi:hypothetical protein
MSTRRNHWLIGIFAAVLIIVGGGVSCASDNATHSSNPPVASTPTPKPTTTIPTATATPTTTPTPSTTVTPTPKPTTTSTTPPPPPPPPSPTSTSTSTTPTTSTAPTFPTSTSSIPTSIPYPIPTLKHLNPPPTINEIIFNNGTPVTITPNTTAPALECPTWTVCEITCQASDTDNDNLNYTWSTSGGVILGNGNKISWTAPGIAGIYTITVTVTDGKGGRANFSIMVRVT